MMFEYDSGKGRLVAGRKWLNGSMAQRLNGNKRWHNGAPFDKLRVRRKGKKIWATSQWQEIRVNKFPLLLKEGWPQNSDN